MNRINSGTASPDTYRVHGVQPRKPVSIQISAGASGIHSRLPTFRIGGIITTPVFVADDTSLIMKHNPTAVPTTTARTIDDEIAAMTKEELAAAVVASYGSWADRDDLDWMGTFREDVGSAWAARLEALHDDNKETPPS